MPEEKSVKRTKALGRAYMLETPDPEKCTGCGRCVEACWYEGIELKEHIAVKTKKCIGCGYCFNACPSGALALDAEQIIGNATEK